MYGHRVEPLDRRKALGVIIGALLLPLVAKLPDLGPKRFDVARWGREFDAVAERNSWSVSELRRAVRDGTMRGIAVLDVVA